jgi:hypothetical protein
VPAADAGRLLSSGAGGAIPWALVPVARPGQPERKADGETEQHPGGKPQWPPQPSRTFGHCHGFIVGG